MCDGQNLSWVGEENNERKKIKEKWKIDSFIVLSIERKEKRRKMNKKKKIKMEKDYFIVSLKERKRKDVGRWSRGDDGEKRREEKRE
jgi:hypothetical protein